MRLSLYTLFRIQHGKFRLHVAMYNLFTLSNLKGQSLPLLYGDSFQAREDILHWGYRQKRPKFRWQPDTSTTREIPTMARRAVAAVSCRRRRIRRRRPIESNRRRPARRRCSRHNRRGSGCPHWSRKHTVHTVHAGMSTCQNSIITPPELYKQKQILHGKES